MDRMTIECLKQVASLLDRAQGALLPDMIDAPTARAEVQAAEHLLSVILDCLSD